MAAEIQWEAVMQAEDPAKRVQARLSPTDRRVASIIAKTLEEQYPGTRWSLKDRR